jgi:hypothetical protein
MTAAQTAHREDAMQLEHWHMSMGGMSDATDGPSAGSVSRKTMKVVSMVVVLLTSLAAIEVRSQGSAYPPLSEYIMAADAEVALARSAAPPPIAARATIKILTPVGYQLIAQGDNGFVCLVMRGWAGATSAAARDRDLVYYAKLRAPICFDPVAARTVLPLQELQAKLGMAGKGVDQIAAEVRAAYASGALPRMEAVAFAYMFSADQDLGPGVGA